MRLYNFHLAIEVYNFKPLEFRKPNWGVEGVLDKGVSGQPEYILWPDCWTMKIQDSRLRPVSGGTLLGMEGKLGNTDM